ncbi:Short-chain dehydrogenase [Kitasatospora sp. MMS16-BH015]|uniref:SDR family NAD(P)-dependent oxidoreductase n=1 Tax=Kitasatospora sp. MMS16-BH015 TaxID=2018025 RepID=UPI000CA112AF|nr:SDR family oxidoreductase [Kitasatospora sp. MMS16-BH015]AUG78270.1 Short-chain dehydrogenase [Kitasatospora sp. MMS16-BH015]
MNAVTPPAPAAPVAAVIGGTRGLGRQLALQAREAGLDTYVYGRSVHTLDAAETAGLTLRELDLTDPASVDAADLELPGPLYLFWVAGAFLKKPLVETTDAEIEGLTSLLLTGPLRLLRRVLSTAPSSVHLITIASSSGWRRRENESLYCALKAAQAHVSRSLVPELVAADPANRVTVINPGGLAVPDFHTGLELDFGTMMDPAEVAGIIWRATREQTEPFQELQILRSREPGSEGTPIVSHGPRVPEQPL